MKKITLILLGFFLYTGSVNAQAIDDRAVIPVAVNLNSILRLNVVSGGSIEFNFNTLDDYTNGINAGGTNPGYMTRFNVASSVNWNVFMYAEDATLMGTDEVGSTNTMEIDNIGFHVDHDGTGDADHFDYSSDDPTAPEALTANENFILVGYNGTNPNAGDIRQNAFVINWRCGTSEGNMEEDNLLEQGLAADRYATNVFLLLQPFD